MKRAFAYFGWMAIVLAGVAAVNDIACRYLTNERFGMSAGKMRRFFHDEAPGEIPVLGSSIVKCGILPSFLSPKSYNYGEDGMLNFEVLSLLKFAVGNCRGGVLVFNLDPWWYSDNSSVSRYRGDYVLTPESGVVSWIDALPGVRFFGRFRPSLVSWIRRTSDGSKFKIDHGAVSQNCVKTFEQWKSIYANLGKDDEFVFNADADRELRACIDALGEKKLVITTLPCVSEYRRRHTNVQEFVGYLNGLDAMKNVVVIDLFTPTNAVPNLDEGCFFDHQHLNAKGAEIVTKVLRQRMLEAGIEL